MDPVVNSLQDMFSTIARWLPALVGALIVLLVGYIIARAIEALVRKGLKGIGFDRLLHKGTAGSYIERLIRVPSALVGSVVFWSIWIGALSVAVSVLGISALTNFINIIYAYMPNVVAALLIFIVASAVSAGIATLVSTAMSETALGKLVATGAPVLIMLIAVFMILNQLQIAPAIVTITYAVLTGAVGLGMALAFGLGGREVAAKILAQAYTSSQAPMREGVQQARQSVDSAIRDVQRSENPIRRG